MSTCSRLEPRATVSTVNEVGAPLSLLLVEDNPIEARAAVKGLQHLSVPYAVNVVDDGDAAIAYLTNAENQRPDLVLLDLNLPGRDGLDVLERVKTDPDLRRIPVIVLTTSSDDADVRRSYDRGANAYLNKPAELAGWKGLVERIEGFWFQAARLPQS